MDAETTQASAETNPTLKSLAEPTDAKPPKPRRSLPPGYLALWVITLLSLLLNAAILRELVILRQAARQAIGDAIATIDDLQGAAISYTAIVDDSIQLETDLPINETIPVPINQTFEINAAATVPIRLGPLGTQTITVPIGGSVPINTTLNIVIDQPFHISTQVPIHLEVPVQIAVKDTPLAATLNDVRARLEALALRLDRPLLPFPQSTPEPTP